MRIGRGITPKMPTIQRASRFRGVKTTWERRREKQSVCCQIVQMRG